MKMLKNNFDLSNKQFSNCYYSDFNRCKLSPHLPQKEVRKRQYISYSGGRGQNNLFLRNIDFTRHDIY